jgi:SAM-dependent methyltransferase
MMKTFFQYVSFFFYNAINWSPWLAFFILYHDIRGSRKYGIRTFAPKELSRLTIVSGDIKKSSRYEALNYYILEKLLAAFRVLSPATGIIDLGCGKGRVMTVAAHYGFTNITGIDFAKELCKEAEWNMKKTGEKFPAMQWTVINANVLDYTIRKNDSVFFMFNPFKEEIILSFLDKLEGSYRQFPRTIYFLYASPQHMKAMMDRGYQMIYQKKIMNLEGVILIKDE